MKPKLLVVELWGLGDLIIATPFLKAAAETYEVTLVAKPYAEELGERFWPQVKVIPFKAPWTAFEHKYRVWAWPWKEILSLRRNLRRQCFDVGLSARWDPRDHFLLLLVGARTRMGFPRLRSEYLLHTSVARPDPAAHRYEHWRALANELGIELPAVQNLQLGRARRRGEVLLHTGAGQHVRVWPLDRYARLLEALRNTGYEVQVACDADQKRFWLERGEQRVTAPATVNELLVLINRAAVFVGNDSGPGHLAAFSGVPTFTLFGPQLPEWFAPLHPAAEWVDGKPCPFKPCSDYCRFPAPRCMLESTEEEVRNRALAFLGRNLDR